MQSSAWVSATTPLTGASATRDGSRLSEFLEVLEDAYISGGDEIENLVSVSFLEHLPRPGEPGSEIRERLGPALRRQLAVIG
jgi:hypothetical protein